MVRKEKLAIFKGSSISETGEAPPTKIGVHVCDINLYSHKFLSRFRSNNFFDDHGLLSMVRKGKLVVFEGSSISKTGGAPPIKIVVYACNINFYLHELFEPILID